MKTKREFRITRYGCCEWLVLKAMEVMLNHEQRQALSKFRPNTRAYPTFVLTQGTWKEY